MTFLLFCNCGIAATLHYGSYSTTLTEDRKTTPSLNVLMDGKRYYGALGIITSGGQSGLNLSYDGSHYILGEYCGGGTYSSNDVSPCTNCEVGYYCTGGSHREACAAGMTTDNANSASINDCGPKSLSIYLDPDGGTPMGTIILIYNTGWQHSSNIGQYISAITTNRTKDGYTWGGFYSEKNCQGIKIMNNDRTLIITAETLTFTTENTSAYACWI
ncbi:MAG: hypothetical protein LBF28_00785 [Rickettsiales bacterium]|nr:hypothetical protein [Rickettsiales bacterium]